MLFTGHLKHRSSILLVWALLAVLPGFTRGQDEPGTGATARFRVTIDGFQAHHETRDQLLNDDGDDDEVLVRVHTFVSDPGGGGWRRYDGPTRRVDRGYRTRLFRDVSTGEAIPGPAPRLPRGPIRLDDLPLFVWAGELVKDRGAVVILPTLWEYDNADPPLDDVLVGPYSLAMGGAPARLASSPLLNQLIHGDAAAALSRGGPVFGASQLEIHTGLVAFEGGFPAERPIGMSPRPDGRLGFIPPALVLTLDIALRLAEIDSGAGRGVTPIRFREGPGLEGDYTLFVRVERIAGPTVFAAKEGTQERPDRFRAGQSIVLVAVGDEATFFRETPPGEVVARGDSLQVERFVGGRWLPVVLPERRRGVGGLADDNFPVASPGENAGGRPPIRALSQLRPNVASSAPWRIDDRTEPGLYRVAFEYFPTPVPRRAIVAYSRPFRILP